MNRATRLSVSSPASLFCALLLLACQTSSAQYGGVLLTATAQTPVAIGQPLEFTVAVSNNTSTTWHTGGDFTFSWLAEAYNASWTTNLELICTNYTTVQPGSTDSLSFTLNSTNLPTAPGIYQFSVTAAYNWYTLLSFMANTPQTVTFTVVDAPPNHPPILTPIGDRTAFEGTLLSFQVSAVDTDTPPQTLTFSLGAGAPFGATINPTNGWFAWTPPLGYAPHTNRVSIVVRDSGLPPMSATNTFKIVVTNPLRFLPPAPPSNGLLRLIWLSTAGKNYRVRYRDQVASGGWTNLAPDILATSSTTSITNLITTPRVRFYQLLLLD